METAVIVNIVLVSILAIGALIGFIKGFVRQAIQLLGAIGAFILAIMMAGSLAAWLEPRLDISYSPVLVVAFVLLLIAGLFVTHILSAVVGKLFNLTLLKSVDRFAGGVLGLVTGMIIGSLLITATLELPLSKSFRREVADSSVALFLRPIAGEVYNWIVARASVGSKFEDVFRRNNSV